LDDDLQSGRKCVWVVKCARGGICRIEDFLKVGEHTGPTSTKIV